MHVDRIFIRAPSSGEQLECDRVSVVASKGIEGDRYFGRRDEPGRNITLVEAEVVEAFIAEQKRAQDLSITHRNVVTRGVRLNDLIGREFRIGDVRLRGVELCEPCLGLGKALATDRISAAAVVKRFVHQGGIRANVLSSGVIVRGARIDHAN